MSEPITAAPVREGDIIAGKFRVERVLGMGGMGVVVAATHLELEQRVALKFLLPQAANNPEVAARFGREARAAAKIRSEHVARVTDVGTLPDGLPYMVMEYMDGEDLEKVLARHGPLPVDVATGYVLEACEAIAEAHALGIVHRDLKPSNLFLARTPSGPPVVKVLDFGISKSILATSEAHLTKTSAIVGSPLYMSPEQLASARSVDTRSDVWAIGVVLYELLVGRTPFPADTMPELVAAILQRQLEPIRTIRPDVPVGLAAAIERCLEKDPGRRFSTVAELAQAIAPFAPRSGAQSLERIAHVLGVSAGTSPLSGGAVSPHVRSSAALAGTTPSGAMTSSPWSQSTPGGVAPGAGGVGRGVLLAIGGLLALIAVVVGVSFALRPTRSTVVSPASDPVGLAPAPPVAAAAGDGTAQPAVVAPVPSSATSSVAGAASVPVTAPLRSASAPPVPRAASHAAAAPPASAAPAPTCRLVSSPDDEGNMHFRRECR